ncbi:hypothetical protein N5D52_17625 [Pseudomonas sp. GD03860]|uniref:toxin-antitoxin system YwqK family antitoxin n=1 Tax=Pseudomonas TaxID=286 RepID=UPI0023632CA0|nr:MULTISPECIES: hypothetical protein [Pseudomonas]MDD2057163.1 hypothetical protein [Pseudomonas putida]MDH0638764.1 hypothetical protein [Pseudomonas sp. GD03860]
MLIDMEYNMRNLLVAALSAVVLTGCTAEIDNAEVMTRNGLIYKYADTDPFSGRVINMPIGLPGIPALCNTQIEKGRYSGKSECFYNAQKVYEVEYAAGNKNGTETVYDAKSGTRLSVKNWKNGRQDGVAEEYQNGVMTHQQTFAEGKPDGKETRWSTDGSKVLTELSWNDGKKFSGYETDSGGKHSYANGQLHGAQIKYGYFVGSLKTYVEAEQNYKDGQLDGVQKAYKNTLHTELVQQASEVVYENGTAVSGWVRQFSPLDGTLLQEIKLVRTEQAEDEDFYSDYPGNLVPDGHIQSYSPQTGQLEGDERWVNGVKETASPGLATVAAVSTETCQDAWMSAYRAEVGEDAMINNEQLGEWEQWCAEGKLP